MNIHKFNKIKQKFNIHLINAIKKISDNEGEYDIIKYSLNNGKRLRPCIAIDLCIKSGGKFEDVIDFAIAIELIHTASLIIDDLPCMDDDMVRRRQPSLHIKYTTKQAQICSGIMVKYAFRLVYNNFQNSPPNILVYIIKNISKNLGILGVAGGQYMDTLDIDTVYDGKKSITKNMGEQNLRKILELKTSSLFEISFAGGYLSGKISLFTIEEIQRLGKIFGLIFQLYDDFLDTEQDKKRVDNNLIDCNYINNFGIQNTLDEFRKLIEEFKTGCKCVDIYTEVLDEIINHLTSKINNKIKNL